QDRCVVINEAGNIARSRIWRDNDRGDTKPQPIVAVIGRADTLPSPEELHRLLPVEWAFVSEKYLRQDIVGFWGHRRRHVVVVATTAIVEPDQKRPLPPLPVHEGVNNLRGEHLSLTNVLWRRLR